jgi:hypothetical protein
MGMEAMHWVPMEGVWDVDQGFTVIVALVARSGNRIT